jgi:neutral ceramidase
MSVLMVGTGKIDITPPLAIPYLSYYPRQTRFQGVHDRLYARTMVVDNGVQRIAVISADALGYSRDVLGPGRDFVREVRQRIERLTAIPAGNIMLAATHAHSTPQTTHIAPLLDFPEARPWLETLIDQLAASVVVATAARRPATLRAAVGASPGIAWCRRIVGKDGKLYRLPNRPPDEQVLSEPRDDRVGIVVAEGEGWRGVLLNFTCHPVTVQVQPLVSADYPGVATDLVERIAPAATCLFLQGAAGNVNPVRHTTSFADVEIYGKMLAGEVLKHVAHLSSVDAPRMSNTVALATATLELPVRDLPDPELFEREIAEAEAEISTASDEAVRQRAIAKYRRAHEARRLIALGSEPILSEVQVLRLGEALIIATDGELFCEYGLELKEASPSPYTFISAYTNGYNGYYITPEAEEQGGYEPSLGPWTRARSSAGQMIVATARELINHVWREDHGDHRTIGH